MKILSSSFKLLFSLFVCLKIKWLSSAIFHSNHHLKPNAFTKSNASISQDLEINSNFSLMGEEIQFLMEPKICNQSLVVVVLSAPPNFKRRNVLRQEVAQVDQNLMSIKLLFLLGSSTSKPVSKRSLANEATESDDILQISVADSYDNLSYKSLSGFFWVHRHCGSAKSILKIDDDVAVFWPRLTQNLSQRPLTPKAIKCPSPMRNMPPWRPRQFHTNQSVMSKWAVTEDEMPRRVYPDFCPGWAYVLAPKLALDLVETAKELKSPNGVLKRLDDIFVTGFLRELINESIVVTSLDENILWNNYFSTCPFLGITRNIFFNGYVKSKGAYIQNTSFYFCAFYEFFILDTLDAFSIHLPDYFNDICNR